MNGKYRSAICHYLFDHTGSNTTNIKIYLMGNVIVNGKQQSAFLADSAIILNEM